MNYWVFINSNGEKMCSYTSSLTEARLRLENSSSDYTWILHEKIRGLNG